MFKIIKNNFVSYILILDKFIMWPGNKLKIIKPLTQVKVYLNKNSICGVLCDTYYVEKDYIRDYKKFNEILDKF